MTRTHIRTAVTGIVAALFTITALTGCSRLENYLPDDSGTSGHGNQSQVDDSAVQTHVLYVVDGDTIVVEPVGDELEPTNDKGTTTTLRLLGIDTPEIAHNSTETSECGGEAATENIKQMAPKGATVVVTFDPKADLQDRYGRYLAYISTSEDGDLAGAQAEQGFAEAWYPSSAPEPTHYADYAQKEKAAKDAGAGSWGSCGDLGRD